MDVVAVALMLSLMTNVVQVVFHLTRLYRDFYQHRKEVEIQKQRRSYQDLQEEDNGPILF